VASKYAVETIYRLIDQVTPGLDRIGIKGKSVGRTMKNLFAESETHAEKFAGSVAKIGKYAMAAGFMALGAGIGIATKGFIEFDNALQKAGGVFSDLDPRAANFTESLKNIGREARAVAAATEFNAMQTADALATMAMAGINSKQAISLLPKTADLATAAGLDLNAAAGIAADALGVFGMMTDDPVKLADNFSYLSDVMVKTASLANMDLPMMYEAVVAGGKEFSKANQSIEEFGAAVDVLAANGYKGSEAGRALNTMMVRLASPAKAGRDALDALGIQTTDASGNLLNFIDIIAQFEKAFQGKGTAEVAGYIDKIFGKNQYTKASAIINAGADALRNYSDQLKDASGATAQMAGVMRQSLQNRIEVLKSAATELGFKFVDAFSDKGGKAIESLTRFIEKIDMEKLINRIMTVAEIISGLIKFLWDMRGVLVALSIPLAVVLAHYAKGAILLKVKSAALVYYNGIMRLAAIGSKLWAAAQWLVNAAFVASPIGWIILGIMALIAIIIICVKNWDKITAAIQKAWEWIKNVAAIIWDNLVGAFQAATEWVGKNSEKVLALITIFTGPFGFIISIVKELKDNWGSVVEAFQSDGILGALKQIGKIILSAVLAPIQGLLEVLAKIPGVNKLLGPAIDKIKNFRAELKGMETTAEVQAVVPQAVNGAATATTTSAVSAVSPRIAPAAAQPTVPITQAQQQAYYSRTESSERMDIYVRPEQGAQARAVRPTPSPNIRTRVSGGNY